MAYQVISPIPVTDGGTGVQTNTVYAVLCGGTSTTGPVQSIAGVGTSGQLLTSNGAGALPTFQTASGSTFVKTLTGSTSGGAISPSSGNINLTAGTNISATGSGSSITIATTGAVADSFPTDSGTATPSSGALTIKAGTSTKNCGSSVSISGSSSTVTLNVTDSSNNTLMGSGAGNSTLTGQNNVMMGKNCGLNLSSGSYNIAMGDSSGNAVTTGSYNVGLGYDAQAGVKTGSYNVGIGYIAAGSYSTSESSNICINSEGTVSESNALHIGAGTGTGNAQLNSAFICGITGINVGASPAVLVNSSNQLGVNTSTRNHKHNIEDMSDSSSDIYKLRPVTFAYNDDPNEKTQYGLIAEEVDEVFPNLVYRNKDNEIETVLYNVLPSLLLNEIKKLNERITALENR
jgi:hypothetical protein